MTLESVAAFARRHGVSKAAAQKWQARGLLAMREGKVWVEGSERTLEHAGLGRFGQVAAGGNLKAATGNPSSATDNRQPTGLAAANTDGADADDADEDAGDSAGPGESVAGSSVLDPALISRLHMTAVSASQFSALDVLFAVLRRVGPAKVDLWTYTPGKVEAECLGALVDARAITELRLVLDQSGMHTRGVELYRSIQERFGHDCLRVTKAHAKLAAISTEDGWRILIDGSANLAKNLRFEQVNIRDDPGLWSVATELTTELFGLGAPPDLDAFTGAAARASVRAVAGDKLFSPPQFQPGRSQHEAPEGATPDEDVEAVIQRLLSGGLLDIASALRAKENGLALRQLVRARREADSAIDVEVAERVLFEQGRAYRDAWLNWPTRAGPPIAAALGLPADKVVEVIAAHVHEQLASLGEPEADFTP